MRIVTTSEEKMLEFGQEIGRLLKGGEMIELVGDIGAGKTTLTKGIAVGLDIDEPVQSPTFNISRVYPARDDLELRHYDFYRLSDAGIMAEELNESINLDRTVVVVEWAGLVDTVLPDDRLQIFIQAVSEDSRQLTLEATGAESRILLEKLG